MIWQTARVVANDVDRLTLVFAAPESCQRCARGEGCGAGVFGRLFGRRETRVLLPANVTVACGEWVRVGFEPRHLAQAAGLHYGLPLLGFLAGATVGHGLMPDSASRDFVALVVGLGGFFLVAGFVARRLRPALNPVVERLSCTESATTSSIS